MVSHSATLKASPKRTLGYDIFLLDLVLIIDNFTLVSSFSLIVPVNPPLSDRSSQAGIGSHLLFFLLGKCALQRQMRNVSIIFLRWNVLRRTSQCDNRSSTETKSGNCAECLGTKSTLTCSTKFVQNAPYLVACPCECYTELASRGYRACGYCDSSSRGFWCSRILCVSRRLNILPHDESFPSHFKRHQPQKSRPKDQ